jgi:hypothetical protein
MPEQRFRRPLPTIKHLTKNILVAISEEDHAKLLRAREKLKVPMAEIIRYATFEYYLPGVFGENK